MKQTILLLILFFVSNILFAQNQNKADSLLTALIKSEEDTTRLDILVKLSGSLASINGDYDNARKYAARAISLADKLSAEQTMQKNISGVNRCKELKGSAFQWIGIAFESQGNYTEALKNEFNALNLFEEIGQKKAIAIALTNIGAIYKDQSDYPEALKYHTRALKIKEEVKDTFSIATSYQDLGELYRAEANYPEALGNYFKAVKVFEEIGNKRSMGMCYVNMGLIYEPQGNYAEALKSEFEALKAFNEIDFKRGIAYVYNNIGAIYKDQNNYTEALKYHSLSLKIKQEMNDQWGIAVSLQNMGVVYEEGLKNHDEALKYDLQALKIFEKIGNKEGVIEQYVNIGEVNGGMNKYREALTWFNKGLKLAQDINFKEGVKVIYSNLSETALKLKDYKKAYEYHKLYSDMKDTLLNETSNKQITEMKTKYETEKKDNEIQLLNKDKVIQTTEIKRQTLMKNGFIGGFVVVLLFAGVFFAQRNRISKGKKRSDELLLNILPSETAEELKATGKAKAKSYDMVTVLFTDFKNFTQISERMSAEELVGEIHYCYSEFDKIISNHGIEKIKTIGDSYMCAGGLPVKNKTNPSEVVKAALEIQQFIAKEKEERQKNNKPFFEIRIGVNTGPVVAGIVGIKKFAYDIWGDTVNIASRMESSGEVGKVNISESTYNLVKDKFICTYRGKIDARNKGMIDMHFVDGEKT